MKQTLLTDEQKLWKRYKRNPSVRLRNMLIARYYHIVKFQAERVGKNIPVELDDLKSEGMFGLISAIERFDPERGNKFATYAKPVIRGKMRDYLRSLDWLPRLTRIRHKQLQDKRKEIEDRMGRPITDTEFAKHLQISFQAFNQMMRNANIVKIKSLDQTIKINNGYDEDDNQELSFMGMVKDCQKNNPLKIVQNYESRYEITRSMNRIDAAIIQMYYWDGLTMKEIGKAIGISESRISQRHAVILKYLKAKLIKKKGAVLG